MINKKTVIKIINKELDILKEITQGFEVENEIHDIEVELTLSKLTNIYNMLRMLKSDNESVSLKQIDEKQQNDFNKPILNIDEKPKQNIENNEEKPIVENKTEGEINTQKEQETKITEDNSIDTKKDVDTKEDSGYLPEQNIATVNNIDEKKEEVVETKKIESETETEQNKDINSESVSKQTKEQNSANNLNNSILADKFQDKKISVNDTLAGFKNDKNIAALIKDRPVNDLKTAIKINDRIWYIQELFGGDADLYTQTIDDLNQQPDLNKALEYVFSKFNWNQDKKSTISFLELMYRRFTKN